MKSLILSLLVIIFLNSCEKPVEPISTNIEVITSEKTTTWNSQTAIYLDYNAIFSVSDSLLTFNFLGSSDISNNPLVIVYPLLSLEREGSEYYLETSSNTSITGISYWTIDIISNTVKLKHDVMTITGIKPYKVVYR